VNLLVVGLLDGMWGRVAHAWLPSAAMIASWPHPSQSEELAPSGVEGVGHPESAEQILPTVVGAPPFGL